MENEHIPQEKLSVAYRDRGQIIQLLIKFLNGHLSEHPFVKLLDEYKDGEPADFLIALQGHPTFVKSYKAPEKKTLSKEQLKQIRETLSMTQTDFALYVGNVSMRAVQEWESGRRAIPSTVVEILRLNGNL